MIKIPFSAQEIAALHHERFHHPHPRIRVKTEVLWLKSQGVPHQHIARLTKLCENTVRNYLRAYAQGGIEGLKRRRVYRPQSMLLRHRETLESYFRQHPPVNIKHAMVEIERLTGVRRGVTQVRQFIKRLGLGSSRPGTVQPTENGFGSKSHPAAEVRGV
jgi:transposase